VKKILKLVNDENHFEKLTQPHIPEKSAYRNWKCTEHTKLVQVNGIISKKHGIISKKGLLVRRSMLLTVRSLLLKRKFRHLPLLC